jgi:hypothetical protein
MSTLGEIEAAIDKLPASEFRKLLQKMNERDAAEWDRQIENDARNGNLDRLYSRVMEGESDQTRVALNEVLNKSELS